MTIAVSVFDWTKQLRYARVGRTAKLVGLMLATFADPDGTEAYPGVPRLAVACRLDYKTVKRSLAELGRAGLVVKADSHSGKRGRYTVYYLTLPDDAAGLMSPDEFNSEVERVREANRRKPGTGNGDPPTSGEVRGTADPVPSPVAGSPAEEVQGLSVPQIEGVGGLSVPQYRDSLSAVPIPTPEPVSTFPSLAENLFAAVTATRDATPNQDPDFAEEEKPRLRLVPPVGSGNGFCLACYAAGKFTVATDPKHGSACALHLREAS